MPALCGELHRHLLLVGVTIESIVVGVKRDELVATARRKSGNERVPPRVLVALGATPLARRPLWVLVALAAAPLSRWPPRGACSN